MRRARGFILAAFLGGALPVYSSAAGGDINLDLSPQNFKAVKSPWEQYFCRHYVRGNSQGNAIEKTIRDYDGPNVGLPAAYAVVKGYRREELLRNFRNWRRSDARGLDVNAAEIIGNDLTVIYGGTSPKPDGALDIERSHALLDSIYGYDPRLAGRVYIQWGNEINGKHIGLPRVNVNERLGVLESSGKADWPQYNRPEDRQPFVENYFLPAVSVTREVSARLFNDPAAIKIMSPSFANIYNPGFREWMYGVLDFQVDAKKFPGLNARQAWETIDILTVHYPFARPNGADVMQEIWDRYGATGKIGRLWVTEEYGRDSSGPAGLIDRGLRYFSWVAANGLDSSQTRLCWWGIEAEYAGGKPADAAVAMNEWLSGRQLRYRQFNVNGETIDAIHAGDARHPRYLLVFRAAPRPAQYRIGLAGESLPSSGVKATLYGSAAKPAALPVRFAKNGNRLDIDVEMRGDGPLLLFIGE
jgi:hypothetical protein